ncbi:MAG: TRAP transporter small permease subunit, partial [Pseudomonadota bacterium]
MGFDRTVGALEKLILSVTRFFNAIGVFFLTMMMVTITVDVVLRYFFNAPIDGSLEIIQAILVLTILLAIPYTTVRKQHVSIDIVTSKFSERVRARLEGMMTFISLALCALLVWRAVIYAMLKYRTNEMSTVLHIPLAPLVGVVAFGFALAGVVLLIQILRHIDQEIKGWKQGILWMVIGAAIFAVLYVAATELRYLPWRLSLFTTGLIGLALVFAAFLAGLPIFLSLIFVGFFGMCYLRGLPAGLSIMGSIPFSTVSHYEFSVIPLFVLMGEFCFYSGIGRDLYDMAYKWLGRLPGGLSIGTVGACGGFAAVCGDSMATA